MSQPPPLSHTVNDTIGDILALIISLAIPIAIFIIFFKKGNTKIAILAGLTSLILIYFLFDIFFNINILYLLIEIINWITGFETSTGEIPCSSSSHFLCPT